MEKGTNVYVKSVCDSKVCSCQSCKICQQMQKKLSLQCFPESDDICDRHRGKKQTTDKSQLCKKDSFRVQSTKCECQQCSCEICKYSKKVNPRKMPVNHSSHSSYDPDDICERHRGRKKQGTDILVIKKPTYKLSKSLPPSPSSSKPGRKMPKLKPSCECMECHCIKCNALKQVSLRSFTEKDESRKKTDDCQMCSQIKEQEKKLSLSKKTSREICSKLCKKKPKQAEDKAMPPCDCNQCECKRCKEMRKRIVKYTSTATEPDEICDRHRARSKRITGECRLCKEIREKQEKKPSILNILNSNRTCNCEVVANALGSMKYDMASMHPLDF